jgi:hypothetical protein
VSQFVDECRQEWKRLGVPDPAANEMAADLEADLEEAKSEGISPEEVLGDGAFDPRSFAAAWASERGLIHPNQSQPAPIPPPPVEHKPRHSRTLSLVSFFAVLVVLGAALGIVGAHQAVAMIGPVLDKPLPALPGFPFRPPGISGQIVERVVRLNPIYAAGPLILLVGVVGLITMLVLWTWRRVRAPVAPA